MRKTVARDAGRVWSFDIETETWDIFLLGAAVSGFGADRIRIPFWSAADVRDWYRKTGPRDIVLSHNGGRFDFLYLLDVVSAEWTATMAGSTIVSMRVKGHAECRDTYRFAPLSLQTWTGGKMTSVLPCECGKGCPGYCAFRRDMSAANRARVMEYCISDAELLLDVWTDYVQRLDAAGVAVYTARGDVRRTIGGIAWATLEKICAVGDAPDFETYDAELRAYYGGRVEVFRTSADSGHRYDVNSMYTWGLLQPTPIGACTVIDRAEDASRAFAAQRHGQYFATVYTAPARLALVPRRGDDGSIIWATGTTSGWYTEPELRAAVERGAVATVTRARVWPALAQVYRPWVELAYGIRERAALDGDAPMRAYAKWLCNSATGKLAQGCEAQSLYVNPGDEQLMRWHALTPESRDERLRWLGADAYVDTTRRQVPTSARPIHAAYLISHARGSLLRRLERADAGALYCDTDAVYQDSRDDHESDDVELGKWKYEGAMTAWEAVAPKLYRYTPEDGNAVVKAKGIPLDQNRDKAARSMADIAILEALKRGESVPLDRGVCTVKTAYDRHQKAFVRKGTQRALRSDRRLAGLRYVMSDGSTVAPHRAPDGSYTWPGVDAAPRDLTDRLTDGA